MRTPTLPTLSALAVAVACWFGTAASWAQSLTNFTGVWNNVMLSTPAQLSLVTRTDTRNSTLHVTVTDVPERTQFEVGVMTLTMDGNGNFSGPANGTVAIVGPGLMRATPIGNDPVTFNVNAAQDVAFAMKQGVGSPQQDLELLLKAPAAMTSAELAGTWKLVSFGTPRFLVLHRSTNFSDPERPIEGVVNIEGREEFTAGSGTMTVAADGSFTLVFGADAMAGTTTPGPNGLLNVTIPMPPNPSLVLSFYVNASKNVMAAVHTEQNYQEIIMAVKLPVAQTVGEAQGLWRVGGFETPLMLTQAINGLGFVSDLPQKQHFNVNGEQVHIGHTGMFTTPADRGLGRLTVVAPGTVQASGTNDAGHNFTTTLWCNSTKDFFIATRADDTQELTLVARAPAEGLPGGPAEFGLIMVKIVQPAPRLDFYWASAAGRVLQSSTNLVDWRDLAETVGGHSHTPGMANISRAYYRLRQTAP